MNRAVMAAAVVAALGGLAGCASAPVSYHTLQVPAVPGHGTGAQPDLRYQIAAVNLPERLNRVDMVLSGAPGRRVGGMKENGAGASGAAPGGSGDVASAAPIDTRVTVLETERWDASLPDVLRDALSQQLAVAASQPAEARASSAPARLRLSLQVYRFDGSAGGDVDVLLDWQLRRLDPPDEAMLASLGDDAGEDEGGKVKEVSKGVEGTGGARGADGVDGADGGRGTRRGPDEQVLACRYQGRAQVPAGQVPAMVTALQQQVAGLASDIVASSRAWLRGRANPCVQASR